MVFTGWSWMCTHENRKGKSLHSSSYVSRRCSRWKRLLRLAVNIASMWTLHRTTPQTVFKAMTLPQMWGSIKAASSLRHRDIRLRWNTNLFQYFVDSKQNSGGGNVVPGPRCSEPSYSASPPDAMNGSNGIYYNVFIVGMDPTLYRLLHGFHFSLDRLMIMSP